MKSLVVRGLSGVAFVGIMLGSLYVGPIAFAAVMALAMVVCVYEFYRMVRRLDVRPQALLGMMCSVVLFAGIYGAAFTPFSPADRLVLYAAVPMLVLVFCVELFSRRDKPFDNIAYTLLGVLYVAAPFSLTSLIVAKAGIAAMLCFFVLLWANDTFAFLFGISLGRHKLLPAVSPKKSWEGYVGGILSVVAFSYLLHRWTALAWGDLVAFALIISIVALPADLVESLLKRKAGVKDSGRIMPGHGGLLDRFDAALLSLPLVWVYVMLAM